MVYVLAESCVRWDDVCRCVVVAVYVIADVEVGLWRGLSTQ
jgi:hypothetical protein